MAKEFLTKENLATYHQMLLSVLPEKLAEVGKGISVNPAPIIGTEYETMVLKLTDDFGEDHEIKIVTIPEENRYLIDEDETSMYRTEDMTLNYNDGTTKTVAIVVEK